MVQYGLDYTRCRWIMPLLLGLAMIFGIIALVGWGWVNSETRPFMQQGSLWRLCTEREEWECISLMDFAWGKAAAATFFVGFVIIVICFALAIIAFAIPTLRFNFIRGIGGLCFVAAVFSLMGLVIYAVMVSKYLRENYPGGIRNELSWSYGFGWTMCLMGIGMGFFLCCLPLYEDHILGNVKPYYA
ncbi:p53 apoptosis effector related to PMP-22-like [Podarcis muralis]|uniref:p53 apoptosis effector related to PMP-22 n=1 Tax=Podarcis muralis TaxID=64176 RepID=A0A670I589_PODMU|nr:p53 apoptosis effector related to PMP-22-like [Podarcis muralis]